MKGAFKKKKNLIDIEEFEQTFRLKGSITPKKEVQRSFNIFEQLGFTTSINSIINDLENNEKIHILSPFSQSKNPRILPSPTKFGAIPIQNLDQKDLDPSVKRIKFVNSFLLKFLIIAIVLNFILIFIL